MHFHVIDSLTLPGDLAKPNEDAFAHTPRMAVVLDGATGLGERVMPGPSDAQWIAQFAARRLRAHSEESGETLAWLRAAASDAEKSFSALRLRPPKEDYEVPLASMMLAAVADGQLHFAWFGDCAALILEPSGAFTIIGDTMRSRGQESERARGASETPAAAGVRAEFLPALRASRNRVNKPGQSWLFAPDRACAGHAKTAVHKAVPGSRLLLASDGFLALAVDYKRVAPEILPADAEARGLAAMGRELRAIEAEDPEGRRYPRYKRSDDATALLLSLGP